MKNWTTRVMDLIRNFFHRRRMIRWSIYLGIIVILFLLRFPIMRGMASCLISADEPENVDYCFIMGGGSLERGKHALKMYKEGFASYFVCTGENVPSILEAVGTKMTEAEATAFYLEKEGIPKENIIVINQSTSTLEEAKVIHRFCEEHGLKKIMLLSSLYHTSRMRSVFDNELEDSGIEYCLVGAPSIKYKEYEWWKTEEGLIAFNNEWMKKIYYWFH